jgi:serine/threonine protein kinase
VLHGLEELHADGVVVLDLKPANVLLTNQGRAMLADFGLARVMQEGATRMVGRLSWAEREAEGGLLCCLPRLFLHGHHFLHP